VGNQIVSDTTLAGAADVFEGVRLPGRYLFVRTSTPFGFSKGLVSSPSGGGFSGALASTDTFPIVALSSGVGTYVSA
ncbi:hypothetical protein NL526_30595, partial [Klebsiella pneumoniae]|nr:hypothetical protein [Klebsiella pneumoniae]